MNRRHFLYVLMMGCLLSFLTGCSENNGNVKVEFQPVNTSVSDKEEIAPKEETASSNNKNSMVLEQDNIIIWTVPLRMNPEIIATNVSRLNSKLEEDGYGFALQVQTFPSNTYRQDVISMLESGEADIVCTGIDAADGSRGFSQDFIRKGYLLELSEYLLSEEGRVLKEWYHEDEWKKVETDGEQYVLPNQNNTYGYSYLAFNKAYVTEEMLKDFTGTPGGLLELLDRVKKTEGVYEILGTSFHIRSLYEMSGVCDQRGVFFDLASGIAENPFANPIFYQHVKDMNSLYSEGRIKIFEGIDAVNLEHQAVREGNFVVWISYRKDAFYEEIKDTIHVVPFPQAMVNALSGTNGISENSSKKESALQLLTLLYTNEVYSNLLLFGEEGTDYQLIEGYVCDMEGESVSNGSSSTFGTFDTAYPCRNDCIVTERRATKDAFFESEYYLDSAILGFQPDCTGFNADMKKAMTILNRYSQIWKETDFESAWAKAKAEFETSGGNELVAELNRQIEEWMQNVGN